jgi:protein O-GlcNAc transferase
MSFSQHSRYNLDFSMNKSDQQLQRALYLHQQGRLDEAISIYQNLITRNPNNAGALHFLGLANASQGQLSDAIKLLERSVMIERRNLPFIENYVTILFQTFDYAKAAQICAQAIAENGITEGLQYLLAITLFKLGRLSDAVNEFNLLLSLFPRHLAGNNEKASVLAELGFHDEALLCVENALLINPRYAPAFLNKGMIFAKLKRYEEALAALSHAIEIDVNIPDVYIGRGHVFRELKRFEAALAAYDKALALNPNSEGAWLGRGNVFYELKRFEAALAAYDNALSLKPDLAESWLGRGNVYVDLRRYDEAFADYNKALSLKQDEKAWFGLGNVFSNLKRDDEAAAAYGKALSLNPDLNGAAGAHLHAKMKLCDWKAFDEEYADLISSVRRGQAVTPLFFMLAIPSSPADQLQCAKLYVKDHVPASSKPIYTGPEYNHGRIHLAYLSADFRNHPVSQGIANLLERHDRSRFVTIGLSIGEDDGSDARARLIKACDQFHDVRLKSDFEIARLIRELEVDILIKVAPHTEGSRLGILAHRPAPIQVNGFSAWTTGADFIDYVLADPHALPFDEQSFFSEQIVHVPDSYFPHDSTQQIAATTPSRAQQGLPEDAFVFCCFNASYKINPLIFEVWIRLLQRIEGSVLWLSQNDIKASHNLKREAAAQGLDPSRLVFAAKMPSLSDHLARHRLADLFLDTLPYGAHTTAKDALWAGVPVLTCRGATFVGRVAVSQLNAVGLPELVTNSLDQYEATALRLAQSPEELLALRDRLAANRTRYPLFDTPRLCRQFEAAYIEMWERQRRGESPKNFAIRGR